MCLLFWRCNFKHILQIGIFVMKVTGTGMPYDLIDDNKRLFHVMVCCHKPVPDQILNLVY